MRKPTWGDTVRIKGGVRPTIPGHLAAVCGMRKIETTEQADHFGCAIGTIIYLVEFGDGSSLEIAEPNLEVVGDGANEADE